MGKSLRRRGITWCVVEGKFAYKTAADAKRAIDGQLEENAHNTDDPDPGGKLGLYPCRHVRRGEPKHFHIGHHVPRKLRKGRP